MTSTGLVVVISLFLKMNFNAAGAGLKPDPVPDELIRRILEAGACAANGGANQRWRSSRCCTCRPTPTLRLSRRPAPTPPADEHPPATAARRVSCIGSDFLTIPTMITQAPGIRLKSNRRANSYDLGAQNRADVLQGPGVGVGIE